MDLLNSFLKAAVKNSEVTQREYQRKTNSMARNKNLSDAGKQKVDEYNERLDEWKYKNEVMNDYLKEDDE